MQMKQKVNLVCFCIFRNTSELIFLAMTYFINVFFKQKIFNSTMPNLRTLQVNQSEIEYEPKQIEGDCVILAIQSLKRSQVKYIIYILFCILTLGILALITYWWKGLQKKLLYDSCDIDNATYLCIENYDNQIEIIPKMTQTFFDGYQNKQFIYFVNRYLKYAIQNKKAAAIGYYNFEAERFIYSMSGNAQGWRNQQTVELRKTYGPGTMIIQKLGPWDIFVREVFRPLYIFLILNIMIQIPNQYYYFAAIIFVSAVASIIITIIEVMAVNEKIYEMAFYEIYLNTLRDGAIIKISSLDIVPGDIVFFLQPIRLPFESVLLQGEILMNQCVLTGQSVPVVKKAETLDKILNKQKLDKNCYLYQGTTIVQINNKKKMKVWDNYRIQYGVPVCVVRTNFTTLKGQLIRKILYPSELENKFQRQSYKFLYFLFCLTLVSFIALVFRLSHVVQTLDLIKKGLDLITIAVPPTLPICLTVGIIYAVQKLKSKQIYTISPNKVIEGGMLNVMCFDKTGTLTDDEMSFKLLVPVQKRQFENVIEVSTYSKPSIISHNLRIAMANMATNHTVVLIEETKHLIGDPMEIKLLNFSQCKIESDPIDHQVIFKFEGKYTNGKVYKRFDFQSDLQRMSVVAQLQDGKFYALTKGSPQIMLNLMKKDTIPYNYQEKLRQFASSGFRILAIGSKIVQNDWKDINRALIEQDLQFNGFQIFENGLKNETRAAIEQLRSVDINPIMITGDNPITASNIGYQSAILDPQTKTLIVDYSINKGFTEEQFSFTYTGLSSFSFQRRSFRRKSKILTENTDPNLTYIQSLLSKTQQNNYNICLTGSALNHLYSDVSIQNKQNLHPLLNDLLEATYILARTKPMDKAKVVKLYQNLGRIVGMCGDGANDCAALNQANLGLSLSDTEASIAAAFTAKRRHVGSMVELIKQSRAGLATNFSLFNIMASYALIQYTATVINQFFYSYPSDSQFTFWDVFMNLIFVVLLGNIGTVERLTKQRPPGSLAAISNIMQLLVFYIIQLIGQLLIILAIRGPFSDTIDYYSVGGQAINQQRFVDEGNHNLLDQTPQNNVLFLLSNFFYISSILAFAITNPWKKQLYTYWPVVVLFIIMSAYLILLVIDLKVCFFTFNLTFMISQQLNKFILCLGLSIGLLIIVMQRCVLIPLFKNLNEYCSKNDQHEQVVD